MNNDLISIIVPVYNAETFLDKCVDSLKKQSYQTIEIILVDDGSTDNSASLCEELKKDDNRIVVIHKANGGVSSARNVGIEVSKGKFICFVDSDDYVHRDFVLKMYEKVQNDKDIVFCKFAMCDISTNKVLKINEYQLNDLILDKNLSHFYIGKGKVHGSVCRCMFKKSFISFRSFPFNEKVRYCEDLLLMNELMLKNPNLDIVDEYLYYYCENKKSVTKNINVGYSEKYLNGIIQCSKILRDNHYNDCADFIEFDAYIIACKECCFNKDQKIKDKKEYKYRNQYHYGIYIENSNGFKDRLKGFLCYHKWFWFLKILFKLKK